MARRQLLILLSSVVLMAVAAGTARAAIQAGHQSGSASGVAEQCGAACNPENSTCPETCGCTYVGMDPVQHRCLGGPVPPPTSPTTSAPHHELQCGDVCRLQGPDLCPKEWCDCDYVSSSPEGNVYKCGGRYMREQREVQQNLPAARGAADGPVAALKCGDVCHLDGANPCPKWCDCDYYSVSLELNVYKCGGRYMRRSKQDTHVRDKNLPAARSADAAGTTLLQCGAVCSKDDPSAGVCPSTCECGFVSWGPLVYKCGGKYMREHPQE